MTKWIVCQIGAREHYAMARALHKQGQLLNMVTDMWLPPEKTLSRALLSKRFRGRFHSQLAHANVISFNRSSLILGLQQRFLQKRNWEATIERNVKFQACALARLQRVNCSEPITLFSYSYAALGLFQFAKSKGWRTVLGQIDPGYIEEQIVKSESQSCGIPNTWVPAPAHYWEDWRHEIDLADLIIVNSKWSKNCLAEAGIVNKVEVIPLAYERPPVVWSSAKSRTNGRPFNVLFLGQVNVRKGIPRLIEAMKLLAYDTEIHLTIAGPTELDMSFIDAHANVTYVGAVAREDTAELYRAADVFILPTLSDGYALTQLEALAFGVPVIATTFCGEAVQHGVNGWLLSDVNPKTIADAIMRAKLEKLKPSDRSEEFSLGALGGRLLSIT